MEDGTFQLGREFERLNQRLAEAESRLIDHDAAIAEASAIRAEMAELRGRVDTHTHEAPAAEPEAEPEPEPEPEAEIEPEPELTPRRAHLLHRRVGGGD